MTESDIISALLEAAHDDEDADGWLSVSQMYFMLQDTEKPLGRQTILNRLKRIKLDGRLEVKRIRTAEGTLDGVPKVVPVYRITE